MGFSVSEKEKHSSKAGLLRCTVVSDAMCKSRVGKVERLIKHPLVGKYVRRTTKIMFHDEENKSKKGDEVMIAPCRPRSARSGAPSRRPPAGAGPRGGRPAGVRGGWR